MKRLVNSRPRRLGSRFWERRVSVNRLAQVVQRRLELNRQHALRDDIAGSRTNDMHAKQLLMPGASDHLDETVGVTKSFCSAQRRDGESPDNHLPVLLASIRFSEPDACDLRMGERACRYCVVVVAIIPAAGVLSSYNTLM